MPAPLGHLAPLKTVGPSPVSVSRFEGESVGIMPRLGDIQNVLGRILMPNASYNAHCGFQIQNPGVLGAEAFWGSHGN